MTTPTLLPEIEAAIADAGQALVDAWDSAQSGPPHRFAVYTDPEGDPEVAAGWMAMACMHASALAAAREAGRREVLDVAAGVEEAINEYGAWERIADSEGNGAGAEDIAQGKADAFTLAIVDRPATTPTPAPGLDLDAVEAAHARMTAGEWYVHVLPTSLASGLLVFDVGPSDDHPVATTSGTDTESVDEAEANAAGIVALRNAASALIAEVRRLRAQVDADRRAYLDVCDAIARETSGPADAAAKARATRKERDDLRAKLATAKRLGMEACDLADEATGSASEAPDCAEQVADYRERERAIRLSIGKV